ncbi:MAG TPA: S16 family serine protease [Candidatus Norongarragalinales archaeon]|jgi:uncharacterized protein|nr:S16 family serine protease [Candidatus Norongarragalinales archaeon]
MLKLLLIAAIVIAALMMGFGSSFDIPGLKSVEQKINTSSNSSHAVISAIQEALNPPTRIELKLPAVDKHENGLLINLIVERSPGDGGVFFRIDDDNPLVNPETQVSLKMAVAVARAYSNVQYEKSNLYYSFIAPSTIVGGQSAGAATSIATLALLRGERLKNNTLITGTVEPDGSIGPVGGVLGKAMAARNAGYGVLLVPKGESVVALNREKCEKVEQPGGYVQSCKVYLVNVSVAEASGLNVTEVFNVSQAYALMKA